MNARLSDLRRHARQTLTIARRDFVATVFTPVFLLFLFAPLIMVGFSVVGGMGASSATAGSTEKERLVVIAAAADAPAIRAADAGLRRLLPDVAAPPAIDVRAADDDPAQVRAALDDKAVDVLAVMHGPLTRPRILHVATAAREARYLAALAERVVAAERLGAQPLSRASFARVDRATPTLGGRNTSAFFAVFGVFFLTLFLSGQVVSTMAEERSNKVIEILAAAVPLESVFLGKLLGMFGVAILFVTFWGVIASQALWLVPAGSGLAALAPAVGFGPFAFLFAAYFAMAFLLLGSVFLGIGAQASTMREIQMLSLPITVLQVAMFGLASAAASRPGSGLALLAELFPLSSPFAMAGHAANLPALWPHGAALAWQAMWVAIFVAVGARLFRRGVLQSSGPGNPWRRLFGRA